MIIFDYLIGDSFPHTQYTLYDQQDNKVKQGGLNQKQTIESPKKTNSVWNFGLIKTRRGVSSRDGHSLDATQWADYCVAKIACSALQLTAALHRV